VHEPAFSGSLQVFNHYVDQHPLATALLKDRVRHSVKIADFTTLRQWQRSDLWNNFFRLENLNYQLIFFSYGQRQVGMSLNRSTRDFSEEERSMLNLLGPHFGRAYQTSSLFSHLSEAAEGNGQAWLVVDGSGRILFETGKAVHWLVEYFGHNGTLPMQIRDWLKQRASGLEDSNRLALPLRDFSIQRGPKRLTVRSLSAPQAPEHRLILTETSEEPDADSLQRLGLTKREAEVLFWVSLGKRNSEIAEILGARSRTISKHVEKILCKLCVETRTAAAKMAAEVLHLR
jgi:DNA-binding CsgD family transcriptional regulator